MFNIQSIEFPYTQHLFDFTGKTSFQPEVDLLAKAKITHTHTLTSGVSHSSDECALHTRNKRAYMSSIYIHSRNQSHSSKCALHTRQESLLELYLLLQSLKEAIHSKCNLKVHYGTFSHLPLTY